MIKKCIARVYSAQIAGTKRNCRYYIRNDAICFYYYRAL
jgi:hypothetical protein